MAVLCQGMVVATHLLNSIAITTLYELVSPVSHTHQTYFS